MLVHPQLFGVDSDISSQCVVFGRLVSISDLGHYFSFVFTDGSGIAGFVLLKDERLFEIDRVGVEEGEYYLLQVIIRESHEQTRLLEIGAIRRLETPNHISMRLADIMTDYIHRQKE